MREETKEAWPSLVSLATLFLHSLTPTHSVPSLVYCLYRVWLEAPSRLDFDTEQDARRVQASSLSGIRN
jgi:hypothetical protein